MKWYRFRFWRLAWGYIAGGGVIDDRGKWWSVCWTRLFWLKDRTRTLTSLERDEACDIPPEGWHCTREKGHDGPCATLPDDPFWEDIRADVKAAFEARREAR